MKPIINLIQRLALNDPKLRYPEYALDDGKIHVLYMAVPLNATGLYRCILPAITLNTTTTHCAIINDMQNWYNYDRFRPQSLPITDQLIRWAHYIIFPTVFNHHKDFRKLITEFREFNPDVKIFIDVDDDIMNISPYHPNAKRYTPLLIENVLKNMDLCDGVTCTHRRLCDWYEEHTAHPKYYPLPNLMTHLTMPGAEPPPKNTTGKTHLGMTLNFTQLQDVMKIKPVLKHLTQAKKYHLTVFGWDGKLFYNGSMRDTLAFISHRHVKEVQIQNYFTMLRQLAYDIALMPLCNNHFNQMKSNHKLLQYAQLGIPVIGPYMPPYNEAPIEWCEEVFYTHVGDNAQEWIEAIEYLSNNKNARQEAITRAHKTVNENYMIEDNINIWQKCFK